MIQLVSENNYKLNMQVKIEPYLERKRVINSFESFDGSLISYEAYKAKGSKGAVIILHGFTESAEKFREASYYFYGEGYSVYVPDLRGHGNSYRTSQKAGTVNGNDFDDYAKDLNVLIETVVKPAEERKPIYIYSHSLGSAAAILYMEKHPDVIRKAVLSSPMICGNMGMPVPVANTVAKLLCSFGGESVSAPGRCKFNPDMKFEKSDATSKARFEYYQEKRVNNRLLQTNGPSFGWVKASVEARDKMLREAYRIRTPLLILLPEKDKQLLASYQQKFISGVKDAKVIDIKGSKHEIFGSTDEVLKEYYGHIFEFLE